jgi:hypothetical protein
VESNELVQKNSRRFQRNKRSTILDDYKIYMSGDIDVEDDPTSFEEAISTVDSSKWLKVVEGKIKSMSGET